MRRISQPLKSNEQSPQDDIKQGIKDLGINVEKFAGNVKDEIDWRKGGRGGRRLSVKRGERGEGDRLVVESDGEIDTGGVEDGDEGGWKMLA